MNRDTPSLRDAAGYLHRLAGMLRPDWPRFASVAALALLVTVLEMAAPLLSKDLIDRAYADTDLQLMHLLVAGIFAFSLASSLVGGLSAYVALAVNGRISSATRLRFFNHLQHLPLRFFGPRRVGEVTSRFQDVGRALDAVSRLVETFLVQGLFLLLVPPMLLIMDWRLALVALASLPASAVVAAASGPMMRRHWQRVAEADADLAAYQVETLSHLRTYKAMALEHRVFRQASALMDRSLDHRLRAGRRSTALSSLHGIAGALATGLVSLFGWTRILQGELSLGEFIAFSAYLGFLHGPVYQLAHLYSDLQQTAVHLSRMFEYLDAPPERNPDRAREPLPPLRRSLQGSLFLRGVSFSYTPGNPVVQDLNLEIPAGSSLAVVGPSGAGKTTLLHLLASLETPSSGMLLVDGVPISAIPTAELRRQIAAVWQEVSLLRGSVWDNLTLGRPEASRREVDEVVDVCGLREVLEKLPEGYDAPVAEWGSSLSAGQRQRFALARALLRESPIVLLDEATANLDVALERRVLGEAFRRLEGRTVVFVTHRLATARLAERICVLEEGTVAGIGSHRGLMKTCAPYRHLVEASQASEEPAAPPVVPGPVAWRGTRVPA